MICRRPRIRDWLQVVITITLHWYQPVLRRRPDGRILISVPAILPSIQIPHLTRVVGQLRRREDSLDSGRLVEAPARATPKTHTTEELASTRSRCRSGSH